ncbi:hypothetical protein L484_007421 [Morus notabilis]|uniref:Uncharacterized protein n=1 Tax=Morus notabilis TaxID=981085 RepID=W9QZB9_9ROSA|nr:hypothetical protein L484_007421 [Morus notabilis]
MSVWLECYSSCWSYRQSSHDRGFKGLLWTSRLQRSRGFKRILSTYRLQHLSSKSAPQPRDISPTVSSERQGFVLASGALDVYDKSGWLEWSTRVRQLAQAWNITS